MGGNRGELVWDELIPWIIGFGVMILVFVLFYLLTGKAESSIEYLKDLFKR